MRVAIIGGTEFIGRRAVELLAARGDQVLVVHRGNTEPDDLPPGVRHVHADRRDYASVAGRVREFAPDAVVDSIALTAADVDAVLPHLPDVPVVLLSSMDVYRAYELLTAGDDTPLPVPFDEEAPLRLGRHPYRGKGRGDDDYDKLDVEPAYLARGACALRLGMVYGPRDPQRREEFVLRRVRAGRHRIPVGPGATVFTRIHVDDCAGAVLAALDRPAAAAGQVFNIGEAGSFTVRAWMRLILDAAGYEAELVTVAEEALPADLRLTRHIPQHLLASSAKAGDLLGWLPSSETAAGVAASVRWHLAHPPAGAPDGFEADDAALATVAATG